MKASFGPGGAARWVLAAVASLLPVAVTASPAAAVPPDRATLARMDLVIRDGTAKPSLGRLGVTVLDPSGRPVVVTAYRGDVRYDRAGLVAKAVGSFDAGTAGRYTVSTDAAAQATAKLAVGEDPGGAMKDTVLWAVLIMGAGAIAAAAIALRTHRRNRA